MFIITFLSIVSAVIDTLPDYVKIGECVNLVQNDNSSNQILINVVTPNGINWINKNMTKNGTFFNYTFCNNSISGGYTVNGQNNEGTAWAYDYNVNAQGKAYGSVDGILYLVAIFVLVLILGLSLYGFFTIPIGNNKGSEGTIVSINWMKYLKIFSLMIAYLSALAISYFLWNLSYGILEVREIANFFYFIYRVLFIGLIVLFPTVVIISFVRFIHDQKIDQMLTRGLTVR
jgi:hypothetical protein